MGKKRNVQLNREREKDVIGKRDNDTEMGMRERERERDLRDSEIALRNVSIPSANQLIMQL